MLIAGLTGSIGMGKSAAAAHVRARGIAVFDADAEVHRLYSGAAAKEIEEAFPGTVVNGEVDRGKLAAVLRAGPEGFKRLEDIVHPLVRVAERKFLHGEAARGAKLAILEIPLLFETGGDKLVDVTIVVSAPPGIQRQRVMERPGMTGERFESLVSRQLSDSEKCLRADFVVDTGGTLARTAEQLDAILAKLEGRKGTALATCWR